MKKILLLASLFIATAINSNAQESAKRESAIYLTGSTGMSSHNQILAIAKIEYNRQIKNRWFWGVTFQKDFGIGRLMTYESDGEWTSPYRNTVRQDIYQANAMAYYRIPIARNWLSLRAGAGIGLGYHKIHNHVDNSKLLKNKVLPYLNGELSWIVKVSKSIDLKFAPTIIGIPQSFAYSPIKLGEPTDISPMIYDAGFNIGIGVRF